MTNVPNKADDDVLFAANLFKTAGADNTGGSINNSTTETTLATVALSADQIDQGALVIASVRLTHDPGVNNSATTFRLKSSAPSSTLKTITLKGWADGGGGNAVETGHVIIYWDTSSTFTGAVTYTVTGENDLAATNITARCDGLVVVGV